MKVAINRNSIPPEANFELNNQTTGSFDGEFWTGSYPAATLDRSYSGNNLVLSKTIRMTHPNPNGSSMTSSSGVKMNQGKSITFSCSYPLNPINLMSHNDVIDGNISATRGAVGHLGYKLEFENSSNLIGQLTKFKIIPTNPGLVFSRIRSCTMTHASMNHDSSGPTLSYSLFRPITNIDNSDQSEPSLRFKRSLIGSRFCRDKILNFQILSNFESKGIQEFSFTTFKWDSGIGFIDHMITQ